MGISWNDCIAIIPIMAKRKRNILEHQNACNDLITMFLTHFGYETHGKIGRKITDVLMAFYMGIVERGRMDWIRKHNNSETILFELSSIIHA